MRRLSHAVPRSREIVTVLRIAIIAALAIAGAVVVWMIWPTLREMEIAPGLSSANAGLAERGAYLVRAGDCVTCHTDKKGGGQPFAGGLALKTPFGTFYTPNITPDQETGIGKWTDADFIRALKHGQAPDGARLYPAFPYTSYRAMTDEDALAIKAYLFSLAPVSAPNEPHELSFPFSWRAALKLWQTFFLETPPSAPAKSRGEYLVTALGHCAECHSPRNFAGAILDGGFLMGNPAGPEGWKVPALAGPTAKNTTAWSIDEISEYLKSGAKPDFDQAQGPMADVIEDGTKHLTDEDRRAIAEYLKTLVIPAGS